MTHDHELRRRIGLQLRQMYQDTLDEELCDDFIEKLCDAAVRVEARKQREEQRRRKARAGSDGPVPDFRHSRRSQDRIGHRLKQDYAKVLTEDVPQELIELL